MENLRLLDSRIFPNFWRWGRHFNWNVRGPNQRNKSRPGFPAGLGNPMSLVRLQAKYKTNFGEKFYDMLTAIRARARVWARVSPDSLLRNAFGQAITITIPAQMYVRDKYLFAISCRLQPKVALRFVSFRFLLALIEFIKCHDHKPFFRQFKPKRREDLLGYWWRSRFTIQLDLIRPNCAATKMATQLDSTRRLAMTFPASDFPPSLSA